MNKFHKGLRYSTAIGFVLWLLIMLAIWMVQDKGPTLVNNPCAPGYEVFVDGELQDYCTNSASNGLRGWIP